MFHKMSKEKGSKRKCDCGHYTNHLIEFNFLNQHVGQFNNRKIDIFSKSKVDFNQSRTSPSKKSCIICFIESSLKMMKNAFSFILKALLVWKIFQFLS